MAFPQGCLSPPPPPQLPPMTNGSSSGTLGCPTTTTSSRLASSSRSTAVPSLCASVLLPPARTASCWLAVREAAAAGMFG
ncbi:rCG21364, isoform CRA_b [Rattus norvegicus]|uniref:RCG21364, isoform CRA_b n=1 Tax=Rattus norvegicus TaxID=10116 RepID=A6J084_RAT|nr:rCG21364, isoform CRA_b [Rattus norvegicus]